MIAQVGTLELVGLALFALAVMHTFSTRYFEHLAHTRTAHAGLWHLLGEVETVFGFWAIVLLLFMAIAYGWSASSAYLDSRKFVEPMFVFVIMVVAASRPIMQVASDGVRSVARLLPVQPAIAGYFLSLSLVPLLGSLITEPAAMTLAALMLRERIFATKASSRLKYATLGVLFVNVSVGGTLTNFAAPPILMVAAKWEWTTAFMLSTFGAKATLAVIVNALALTLLFRRELSERALPPARSARARVPAALVVVNVAILAAVVFASHDPETFMGLFLLFLGLAEAYRRHHDRLLLREGLMVAFFLAGLIVLGGQQLWWLQGVLSRLDESTLFYGAAALTAITDNAALTYLGSSGRGHIQRLQVLARGRSRGGRRPDRDCQCAQSRGFAILKDHFEDHSINAFGLFIAALPPTLVAITCFRGIRGQVDEVFSWDVWTRWFASLDGSFLFLLILPFVVAAVGLWAEFARRDDSDRGRESEH